MRKKVILFGAGELGRRTIEYIGLNNFYAFVDNSVKKTEYINDKKYLAYSEYKKEYSDYITILSVNSKNAKEIICQLHRDDISDFIVYDSYLTNKMRECSPDEFVDYFCDDKKRLQWERDYYYRLSNIFDSQLSYIKELSDIKKLNRASGYIASVQEKTIAFTDEVFEILKPLNLEIFTAAGTAIGLYRHNGYIPWDDDVDFGLFRQDYIKLLEYGKEHFVYIEIEAGKKGDRQQSKCFREYPNELIMIVSPHGAQIKRGTSWMDSTIVDFFPYDFYEDGYDYSSHVKNIEQCAKWRCSEKNNKRMLNFIEENGHTVEKSNTCSFGLDGMDPYVCPKKGWIDSSVFFPMKRVLFEGVECYAPNKIKEYLSYCYTDFEGYPSDISAIHTVERAEIMKETYISCCIVVRDEKIDMLKEIYDWLRTVGIYCVFVFNYKYIKDMNNLSTIKNILEAFKVEYIEDGLLNYDFIILPDEYYPKKSPDVPCYLVQDRFDINKESLTKIINTLDSDKIEMCFL